LQRFKKTNQRMEILDFLKKNKSHPSVEEVYKAVKKKLPYISKATVYQNIKFLAGKGLLRLLDVDGVKRVEPSLEPHHHCICTECSKVCDCRCKELTEHELKVAKKMKQFHVHAIDTHFYGVCNCCKEKS